MKNWITNKKSVFWLGVIFTAFMFALNCLTQYTADDYSYHYNMLDGSKVNNLVDVMKALYDHYFVQNGRLVAHFFAYVFLLMPKLVFNVVNTAMFLFQLFLIYHLIRGEKENAVILFLEFAFIWLYEPSFGQVNLWLDGSCNYLFSLVFALIYFKKFVGDLAEREKISIWKTIGWCLFSFLVGAYSENLSFCLIFGCFVILLWVKVVQKRKIYIDSVLSIVFGGIGYLFLALSPSTVSNKTADFSISIFICNFKDIFKIYYEDFQFLLFMWVVALIVAFYCKVNAEKIFLSCICLFISLTSSLICMVAKYLSGRSMCGSTIFLILAVLILFYEVWDSKYQIAVASISGIVAVSTVVMLVVGVYDVMWTYNKTARREAYLKEAAANGEEYVVVERIDAKTKYSASYRLPELDPEDWTDYPNIDYEKYYGIDVILGMEED